METPPFLVGQFAAECGLSPCMTKRALYLAGINPSTKTVRDVAKMFSIGEASVKGFCRKLLIDLKDYKPYARERGAGEFSPTDAQKVALARLGLAPEGLVQ